MKYKLAPYEDLIYADILKLAAGLEMPNIVTPDKEIVALLCQTAVIHRHAPEDGPYWADKKRLLPFTPGHYNWLIESQSSPQDIRELVSVLQARWARELKAGKIAVATLAKAAQPAHGLKAHEAQVQADIEVLITQRGLDKAPGVAVVAQLLTLAVLHRTAPNSALGDHVRSLPLDLELYAWATNPELKDDDILKLIEAVSINLYLKALQ